MKIFFNWLVDNYLSRWLIAREDFEVVRQNWRTEQWRNESLLKELQQAYEETYKGFKPFEDYGESVKAKFIEHSRIDLREFQYSYHFIIPRRSYMLLKDPTQYFRRTKEIVISKLTAAFESHMQKNLFRDL